MSVLQSKCSSMSNFKIVCQIYCKSKMKNQNNFIIMLAVSLVHNLGSLFCYKNYITYVALMQNTGKQCHENKVICFI